MSLFPLEETINYDFFACLYKNIIYFQEFLEKHFVPIFGFASIFSLSL